MRTPVMVTIGMCVKDCQFTLRDAVDSVIAQGFPHDFMEIIFVDDGSKDKTPLIIEEYAQNTDINVKTFSHQWKGLGHSRNIVARYAEGKYILWVDGDMILSRDYVRKLVDFMEEHPKLAITKGKQGLRPGGNLLSTLEMFSRAASRMVDYGSEKTRSKALGTGGSIYRVEAMKQAGYFDENLRGYGEDSDIEIRTRAAGWKLAAIDANFQDYERFGLTWNGLWNRYWLRGYYTHYFLHKNKGLLKPCKMLPPVAFITGLLQANTLFKLTHLKRVFLLPFNYLLKMSAWYIGFIKSHIDSYEPKS